MKTKLTPAPGTAEREAALVMTQELRRKKRTTLGGDQGFDTRDFVRKLGKLGVTPHVTPNTERPGGSAIDARTPATRSASRNANASSHPLVG